MCVPSLTPTLRQAGSKLSAPSFSAVQRGESGRRCPMSLPLELHQVLEREYVAMYGPLDRPSTDYEAGDITDVRLAQSVLAQCGTTVAADATKIAEALTKIVDAKAKPALAKSSVITPRGKALLGGYDELKKRAEAEEGEAGVRELHRAIVDEAFDGAVKRYCDLRLKKVYSAIHARANDKENPQPRTALCVSGGGIRSAT